MANNNYVSVHTNTSIIGGEILETMTEGSTTLALIHYVEKSENHYEYYVLYEKTIGGGWMVRTMNCTGKVSKRIADNETLRKSGLAIAMMDVIAA